VSLGVFVERAEPGEALSLHLQPEPTAQPDRRAGTNADAEEPLTGELVTWADVIVVMEKVHRTKLQQRFRRFLNGQRVICLDIPDDFAFMDTDLIRLLERKMARYLPTTADRT